MKIYGFLSCVTLIGDTGYFQITGSGFDPAQTTMYSDRDTVEKPEIPAGEQRSSVTYLKPIHQENGSVHMNQMKEIDPMMSIIILQD